jgi:hypothetical protein
MASPVYHEAHDKLIMKRVLFINPRVSSKTYKDSDIQMDLSQY